jgi:hypothetical protein
MTTPRHQGRRHTAPDAPPPPAKPPERRKAPVRKDKDGWQTAPLDFRRRRP